MKKFGAWAVAAAGAAIILLTYIQNAIIGVYFDDRALPDNISSLPSLGLGLVGLLLILGGFRAAIRSSSGRQR